MELKKEVLKLMLKNRRINSGFQYTVPSPDTYPYQWLWDSCFNAIILSFLNLEDAKKELISLISFQFENGMIPHIIYWDKGTPTDFPKIEWGKEDTSSITQPPLLSYAVWKIYQKDEDKGFLKLIYQNLVRFYNFLFNDRAYDETRLLGIVNPDESGEDNSPRFDEPLGLPPKQTLEESLERRLQLVAEDLACDFETQTCISNFFFVKDVPFNAIMVEDLSCMIKIAKALGNKKDVKLFEWERRQIISGMRKWMLEEGVFWSVYGLHHKKIKLKSWAIFAPLFAGIYAPKEAEKVVERYLLNKKFFNTRFLIPTISKDEPSFDTKGFWRGPVWIAVNYFIFKGLLRYKMDDLAKQVAQATLGLLKKNGFREYFNPLTGRGMGAKDFTWGGLILDMV